MGHMSKFCPKKKEDKKVGPKVMANKASILTQDTKECPCCKEKHTWQPKGQNKKNPF